MKSKFTTFLMMFAVLLLPLSLAGCGAGGSEGDENDPALEGGSDDEQMQDESGEADVSE